MRGFRHIEIDSNELLGTDCLCLSDFTFLISYFYYSHRIRLPKSVTVFGWGRFQWNTDSVSIIVLSILDI